MGFPHRYSVHLFHYFIIISALFLVASVYGQKECNQKESEEFDANAARMMTIGRFGRPWPETEEKHREFCKESRRLNQELDSYKNKCVNGVTKQLFSVFIFSVRRTLKKKCRLVTARDKQIHLKTMQMYRCANKVSSQTGKCLDNYLDSLYSVMKQLKDAKNQIPHVCCNYYRLIKCAGDAVNSVDGCEEESELFQDFIRSIFEDVSNLACGDYIENSDKCDNLSPIRITPFPKKSKSVMIPLVEIWTNIQE